MDWTIDVVRKMKYLKEWEQVYEDPELQANLIRNKNALKPIFEETRWITNEGKQATEQIPTSLSGSKPSKRVYLCLLRGKISLPSRACNLIFYSAQATTTIWRDCHTKNTHVPNA